MIYVPYIGNYWLGEVIITDKYVLEMFYDTNSHYSPDVFIQQASRWMKFIRYSIPAVIAI